MTAWLETSHGRVRVDQIAAVEEATAATGSAFTQVTLISGRQFIVFLPRAEVDARIDFLNGDPELITRPA